MFKAATTVYLFLNNMYPNEANQWKEHNLSKFGNKKKGIFTEMYSVDKFITFHIMKPQTFKKSQTMKYTTIYSILSKYFH